MKKYLRKVFVASLLLSLVIFYLVSGIAQTKQYSKDQYTGPMGLPAMYHSIIAEFYGDREGVTDNDVFDRLLEVLSREDKVTAILNWQDTYLYDPSGYFNVPGINGEYFSKEDFQSGSENNVMIFEDSPYRLMKENGSIYCLGQYRNVVGEYSSHSPLYRISGDKIIPMSPGRLNFNTTSSSNTRNKQITLHIANCSEVLYQEADMAVQNAGWTIIETQSVHESGSQDKGLVYTIITTYKDVVIMLLLMLLMGTVVLRHQAVISCGGCSLRNAFIRGIMPVLIGSAVGCTIAVAVTALIKGKLIWWSIPAAFAVSLVLGQFPIAASCMRIRRSHASEGGIWLRRACSKAMGMCISFGAVILICMSICIITYDMQGMPYFIRMVLMDKRLSHVQVVKFSADVIDKEETTQALSLKQAVENAIKGGSAFSIIRDYNAPGSYLVVGSEAFKKMYKLDWKEDIPAAYIKKSNQYLKKGDSLNMGSATRDKTVEVVRYLDKSFRLYMGEWGGDSIQQDALVLMDLEDSKEAGYDSIKLVQNIYFLDPNGKTLNEFVMKMDEAGMGESMAMFGKGTGQIYNDNWIYYVLILGLIMVLGIMAFLFILAATGTMAERRYTEMKTALLYGGGYRSIWLKVFPLAAVITIPAGALYGIGELYIFLKYRSGSISFIPHETMKEITKEILGKMPVGAAAGLVLAAVVTTVVAGEVGTVLNFYQKPSGRDALLK